MATPEHHRAGLERDPDALWALGPDAARSGDGAVSARALAAEGRLRRLLRINKRLNSELRLPRLLEMIVDTVIELTDAERGFLLLEDDAGQAGGQGRAQHRSAHARDRRVRAVALDRPPGRRRRRADRHHRRRRRRALPRGAVGLRSAPALGAGGAALRSRGASPARSTSTTGCARARSTRTTCGWCSISPSRRRSRSRTRACWRRCAAASARSRRSTAGSRWSWPRGARSCRGSNKSYATTGRPSPCATTTATSSGARRACWICSGCSIASPTRRCRS